MWSNHRWDSLHFFTLEQRRRCFNSGCSMESLLDLHTQTRHTWAHFFKNFWMSQAIQSLTHDNDEFSEISCLLLNSLINKANKKYHAFTLTFSCTIAARDIIGGNCLPTALVSHIWTNLYMRLDCRTLIFMEHTNPLQCSIILDQLQDQTFGDCRRCTISAP